MKPALAFCVLALTLAACGAAPRDSAKDFSGAERAVADTVEELESAARKSDSDQVCTKLLADSLLATLKRKGRNCTTAVKQAFDDADSVELTVDDVSINAGKAVAKVTSGTGSKKKVDTLELEKAGAAWRISSLQA